MSRGRLRATIPSMNGSLDSRRVLIPVAAPSSAVDTAASSCSSATATATAGAAPVRRYRLGRMPLYTRPDPVVDRFAHLRRGYD